MKPHLYKRHGFWWCRTGFFRGRPYVGITPRMAYNHWYRLTVWHGGTVFDEGIG